jgi:hypothetical protein
MRSLIHTYKHRGKTFVDKFWINPKNIYINIGTKPL